MKKLVLFDLDGVLLDSRSNMALAWSEVRRNHHLDVPFEAYFALIGRPFQAILKRLGLTDNLDAIEQSYVTASLKFIEKATFYPKTDETLAQLAAMGVRLGIVTSKDRLRTQATLRQLNARFDTIQTPSGTYRGKPAPDYLLLAMAEVGVDPGDTVYVGDMDTDYEAAVRAGIDYIHAAWGYGSPPDSAPSFSCIDQLPPHIQ